MSFIHRFFGMMGGFVHAKVIVLNNYSSLIFMQNWSLCNYMYMCVSMYVLKNFDI